MTGKGYIQLKNNVLGYPSVSGQLKVLSISELEFKPGTFYAIVGANGSGKSTLLKSICGLIPALDGTIKIDNTPLEKLELVELAKKIAIVLTEKVGGFNLTAFDIVAAGQMPYTNAFHQLNKEHLKIIYEVIEVVGLQNHIHKPVHELSDGLFQKTMIARALAQQTPAILLDEPTAFLDYASKHELFLLLKKLCLLENKCIVVSTHDLDLALNYCSQIVIVADHTISVTETNTAKESLAFKKISGGYL